MSEGCFDDTLVVIRHPDGAYFRKWEATGWETVKRFAHWTRDVDEAAKIKFGELGKFGVIDLVCGFSGLRLERVEEKKNDPRPPAAATVNRNVERFVNRSAGPLV